MRRYDTVEMIQHVIEKSTIQEMDWIELVDGPLLVVGWKTVELK